MLGKRLGIDLGTVNSLVYVSGVGIVLNEPTVVAVETETRKVIAVGNEARQMLGRTPANIEATRPMKDGVIADYVVTEAMLRYFLEKVCGSRFFFKPEVLICVPAGVTQVERRAVLDATLSAGAKIAYLIDEPLAAAIGAGLPIARAEGHMIVDSGGGSTEAAVISLGGVVVHKSARVAGNSLDAAIATYVRRKHNLLIGDAAAEEIKIKIGNAFPDQNQLPALNSKDSAENRQLTTLASLEVRGRDAITGLPRLIEVSSQEIAEALKPVLSLIVAAIKSALEDIPPELASDIIDKGIMLSGGTSLLKNLDKLVSNETGVASYVAEEPLFCVVRGCAVAIDNIEAYKRAVTTK